MPFVNMICVQAKNTHFVLVQSESLYRQLKGTCELDVDLESACDDKNTLVEDSKTYDLLKKSIKRDWDQ